MMPLRFTLGALLAFALWAQAPTLAAADGTTATNPPAQSVAATETPATADAPRMPRWIEEGIEHYGAWAIFVAFVVSGIGLHFSEDFILIPAGWLAAQDWRLFGEFALAAYLGIVIGDAGWFWMCRTFGTRLMHTRLVKRLFHPRRLLEIKWQIDRRGAWVLLAARFIPGTRTPVISMCGVLHMAWWKLLLVEGLCVLVTAPMQMMIGWLAFHAAAKAGVTNMAHQVTIAVAVTLAVVIGLWLVHLWLDARKSKRRPPRASVQWLRVFAAQSRRPAAAGATDLG
jgi:membrane protein DedA with SNARE-associated domain